MLTLPQRPHPREFTLARPRVQAVVLAAGQSSRMRGANKLLALFDGERLIRRTASRVLASKATGAILVTGHQSWSVEEAMQGLDLVTVHNPDYTEGMSTSLRVGIEAVAESVNGAMIVLGDMPEITTADMDRLIDVFRGSGGVSIVRAVCDGKCGNPVILPRALFRAVRDLHGDTGARRLIETAEIDVIDVDIGVGAIVDVDTPEALEQAQGISKLTAR